MPASLQAEQVDRNYDSFVRQLGALLPAHHDEFALMRDGAIVGFYATPGEADRAGVARYTHGVFSIQEVTDEPIDLGFWSHVAAH